MSNEKLTTLEQLMKEMVNAWVIKSTSWDLVNTLNFFDNLDSEKVEALKNTLKEKWMFDELILLNQQILRGLVRQYNMEIIWNKKIFDGSEFDKMVDTSSISTPDADKLKAEIKEAQKAKANKLVEEWKFDEATSLINWVIMELVFQQNQYINSKVYWKDWLRKLYPKKDHGYWYVDQDSIDTPESIEWKEEIKKLQKANFRRLISEWKFDEAIMFANNVIIMIQMQVIRESEKLTSKGYNDIINTEPQKKKIKLEYIPWVWEWQELIEIAYIAAFDEAIKTWDYDKAKKIAMKKFIEEFITNNWEEDTSNVLSGFKKINLNHRKDESNDQSSDTSWIWRLNKVNRLLNKWSR